MAISVLYLYFANSDGELFLVGEGGRNNFKLICQVLMGPEITKALTKERNTNDTNVEK